MTQSAEENLLHEDFEKSMEELTEKYDLNDVTIRSRLLNASGKLRPDLNGAHLKLRADSETIWVIDQGRRRMINGTSHKILFKPGIDIIIDVDVTEIARGPDINGGSRLLRESSKKTIHFLEHRNFSGGAGPSFTRPVTPHALKRFGFREDNIQDIDSVIFLAIPQRQDEPVDAPFGL